MKTCLWCGNRYTKLAESHIIPQAFFNYDGKNDRSLVSNKDYKKRRPTGSYDTNILCNKCEGDFSYIDSEAAEILLNNFDTHTVLFNDKRDDVCYQIDGIYKRTIKIFLMYTLWKASVSTLNEFRRVKLGYYEDKIKNAIINKEAINIYDYSFLAFKIENSAGQIYPYKDIKKNWDGLTYYVLEFGSFLFNVKIDNRKPLEPCKSAAEHQHVPFIKLHKTPEKRRQAMVTILKEHESVFGKNKK